MLKIIEAGNAIARTPYKWGGGHGRFLDTGYDCSGSVSFALYAAGLIDGPSDSGGLMSWGKAGKGKWVTIYSNPGHVYMEVAGIRFDTSGAKVDRLALAERPARPAAGLRRPPPARALGRTSSRRRSSRSRSRSTVRMTSSVISPARRIPSIASRWASMTANIMRPQALLRSSIAPSSTSSSKRAAKRLRR